jgi:hypothetical protein
VAPLTQYQTVHQPAPLLDNLESYQLFLEELRNEYILIIEQCAPKISKHFTRMTQIINEGNSYEFPSVDIHKAVILKLILNDNTFSHLIAHLVKEYQIHEAEIYRKQPTFCVIFAQFQEMLADLNRQPVNIE